MHGLKAGRRLKTDYSISKGNLESAYLSTLSVSLSSAYSTRSKATVRLVTSRSRSYKRSNPSWTPLPPKASHTASSPSSRPSKTFQMAVCQSLTTSLVRSMGMITCLVGAVTAITTSPIALSTRASNSSRSTSSESSSKSTNWRKACLSSSCASSKCSNLP